MRLTITIMAVVLAMNLYAQKQPVNKVLISQSIYDDNPALYWKAWELAYEHVKDDKGLIQSPYLDEGFYAMLAEIPNNEQAARLMEYAKDSLEFGGKYPWPSVSQSDRDFNAEYGDYWKGSIWVPTANMATKELKKYGFYDVVDQNAYNLLNLILQTYKTFKPSTIWECYKASKPKPAQRVWKDSRELVRPDFFGGSVLAPISMFIENVLGFHMIDFQTKTIVWRKYRSGVHGIKNSQFWDIRTDILGYDSYVDVTPNKAYSLIINGGAI